MKKLIIILSAMLCLNAQAQFIFNGGKSTAKVDTLKANSTKIMLKSRTGNKTAWLRVSGDTLYLGDVTGEKAIGNMGGGDSTVLKSIYQAGLDTTKLHDQIITKQAQLNGTGFVKASGTSISYDNNIYLTAIDTTKIPVAGHYGTQYDLSLKLDKADTINKIATKNEINDTVTLTDYTYTKSQLNTSGGGGLVHFDNVTNKYVVYKAIASGSAYSLTTTDTVLLFGTNRPIDTIKTVGTYRLTARINLKYNGATFAANQTATFKIKRVNNTATDISGSSTTITLGVVTTLTEGIGTIILPLGLYYSTNVITDILQLRGVISSAPSAGSVDVTEAEIVAEKVN